MLLLLWEQRRFPCTLAECELWHPMSFIKCEVGSPRPSLAGNNGDNPARFQGEVGALLALLEHKGMGYRIC